MARIVTITRDKSNPQRGSKLDFKPHPAAGPLKNLPAPKEAGEDEGGEPVDAGSEDFGENEPERKGRKGGK